MRLRYKAEQATPPRFTHRLRAMSNHCKMTLLLARRDNIRQWLEAEAPYAAFDQKHLDADTPERAYWHHGYQAALTDVLHLLRGADKSGNPGTPE
jgi:hypothetical protein